MVAKVWKIKRWNNVHCVCVYQCVCAHTLVKVCMWCVGAYGGVKRLLGPS